ncbi:MAG: tRNA guanosine(34) transglycosylase Tgt [bacterium]
MFKLTQQLKNARAGVLTTRHGKIQTPVFMPVATQAAVKYLSADEIKKIGYKLILSNTYHLMLRPGSKLIKKLGGLHKFMNWPNAILTDSGGFQIFSLAQDRNKKGENLVRVIDKGVEFKSYIDGSKHFLSPVKALKIQNELGVDIAVCLDQCACLPAKKEYLQKAVDLTTKWAKQTKQAHERIRGDKPLLFAVIQGGLDKKLRQQSLDELMDIGFDGYNIGGLSVGETQSQMYKVLDYLTPTMPLNKPRYLMGIGYPENILKAVKRGIDMFDCVIPTREGRHGRLFVFKPNAKEIIAKSIKSDKVTTDFYQAININNSKFAKDKTAINIDSNFSELTLSKAYLHYLLKVGEPLGQRLATLNNLEFYKNLMDYIREGIK